MRFVITGTAGFIGFHLARRLLSAGHTVVGIDGITPYYDQALKRRRHRMLAESGGFSAQEMMLEDGERLAACMAAAAADVVVHLAAQAGVRYSNENPRAYLDCNVTAMFNLLEALRAHPCRHFLMASTSSVYGANAALPFSELHRADHPLSLYAATKKAAEAIAHSHAHLHGLPTTVLRLFTVYGPWGRPDMALFRFVKSIIEGAPIEVYGHGRMSRDFTYVDDVVEAVCRLIDRVPARTDGEPGLSPVAPYRIVNIGNGAPVPLVDFIAAIETAVGRAALRVDVPMQPGDVPVTHADTALLRALTGFTPAVPLRAGVAAFVAWYRDYYRA
jgi:UDP-glucuronate 4-epimerase